MTNAIFLACHQRFTELLCHLDILKYCHVPCEKIVLYSGNVDLGYIPNLIKFTPKRHAPVEAVLWALREARARGIERICIRNGDDWLFRHDLVEEWFRKLDTHDIVGYNWFDSNQFNDLTINELYLKVSAFNHLDIEQTLHDLHRKDVSIEHEMAQILKPNKDNFYRLTEREWPGGIGHRTENGGDYNNNRWLHRPWQLITSHDPWQRWEFYKSIRFTIPYHESLEKQRHFGEWMNVCRQVEQVAPQIVLDRRTLLNGPKLYYLGEKAIETTLLPGEVAEVGVYKGGSLKLLAQLCPGKAVHGFDTFCGLPSPAGNHQEGEFACSFEEVRNYVPNAVLHKGIFPQTAAGLEDKQCRLAHIDVDGYQSTLDCIDFFWPRMVSGGWLIIDDWQWSDTPGVTDAVLKRFDRNVIIIRPERNHQAFIHKT